MVDANIYFYLKLMYVDVKMYCDLNMMCVKMNDEYKF